MKLIIAEKPELAKAIAAAIPGEKKKYANKIEVNEYTICWVAGHILRFKEPQEIDEKYKFWNLEDLPIFFEKWDKTYINGKEQLLDNIAFLLKKADEIIHAGDPDDEGQYLIDEVLQYLDNKKPVKRILINNNNIEAIKKAFDKIEDNKKYITLGKAAEARAISDMIVGYNLSRLYSILNDTTLSVGRVQTPTLSLVVNRDLEIENHKKTKYYELIISQNKFEEKINFK